MKKIVCIPLLFMVLAFLPAQEKPVIALFPMQNPTGEDWIDTLGNTVEDVVSLTLAIMGRYEIERPDEPPGDLSEGALMELARREGYDDIILGECSLTERGYRFSVTNFDLYKGRTTVRAEEEFESLLDSFEAADLLTEALIEGLSGVKVRYGGLTLALLRDEPYRTVIDDADVGAGFTGSDRFLVGPHTLRFFQDRGAGESLVAEHRVDILEGENMVLDSPLPWLTPDLAGKIREIERLIAAEGDGEERALLTQHLFAEARKLIEGEYYDRYRPELAERYKTWEELYATAPIDDSDLQNSSSLMETMYLGKLPYNALHSVPREKAGSSLSRGASLLRTLTETGAEAGRIVLPDTATIKVDGRADDWADVKTVFQDEQGRFLDPYYLKKNDELFDGQDIEWVGIAMDEKRIYAAMKTVSGVYSKERNYFVEFLRGNRLRLEYNRKGGYFAMGKVESQDWDNSRWAGSDESPMEGAVRDIIEFSLPWKEILRFVGHDDWTFHLSFAVQINSDPWREVDDYDCDVFIPEFYYELLREQ